MQPINELHKAIEDSWCKETSSDPDNWTPENPSWGQCAVTSLVQQLHEGGILIRSIVNGDKKNSHYYLDPPRKDLTFKQFPAETKLSDQYLRTRSQLLSNTDTRQRFQILYNLVASKIGYPEIKW